MNDALRFDDTSLLEIMGIPLDESAVVWHHIPACVTRCSHGVKLTDPTAAHRKDHWQPCLAAEFHGGRFENQHLDRSTGPLESVGQRLIGPGARRQLATSLSDFMSGQKVCEVRYVSAGKVGRVCWWKMGGSNRTQGE